MSVSRLFKQARAASQGEPRLASLRGEAQAPLWMVAPPPLREEYEQGLAFGGPIGQQLHFQLMEFSFDSNADCLVVPCVLAGLKVSKFNATVVGTMLKAGLQSQLCRGLICVGSVAFKHLFGRGKLPPSTVLGRAVTLPEYDNASVFVLPDPTPLYVVPGEDWREQRKRQELRDRCQKQYRRLGAAFQEWRHQYD